MMLPAPPQKRHRLIQSNNSPGTHQSKVLESSIDPQDTRPTLPYDAQVIILEWVYQLSQNSEIDYDTLAKCSRVCRSWKPVAQRLLFRRIPDSIGKTSPSSAWIAQLVDAVRENPILGTYVRTFFLELDCSSRRRETQEHHVELLRLCPNVAAVSVNFISRKFQLPLAVAQLKTCKISPGVLTVTTGDHLAIAEFLRLWPMVRYLKLAPRPLRARRSLPPSRRLLRGKGLPDVSDSLLGLDIATYVKPAISDWLLSVNNESSALCELHGQWPTGSVPDHVVHNLRTVMLLALPQAVVLEKLTQLEVLVANLWPSLLPELPRSVRHIGFHVDEGTEITVAEELARELPSLPHLQVVTATHCTGPEGLSILEAACHLLNVEFRVIRDCTSLRDVDWI